jgi:Transmembrane secretion effector
VTTTAPKRLSERLGVLSERNFRRFLTGYVTSRVGSAMVPVALTFAVLNQGRGTTDVSYVLAGQTVPLVGFLLLGGAIADRLSRRALMLGADLARFVSEGVLAVLLITGSPPLWAFVVLAGVLGAGQAFFSPAMTGLIPAIVPRDRLQHANALRGVATSMGQILGPILAGVIVATAGAGWAVAVDSATYAVSAACLANLKIAPRARFERSSILSHLAAGWREFRSRTWLWVIVAQFATFNAVSVAPFMVLGAVVAHHRLGGAGAWGAILATLGAGSILGGLIATRLRATRPLVSATLGTALFALPTALIAVPAATPIVALAAGAAGIGLSIFDTLWQTTLQSEVPERALSRVSAYDWLGSAAFVPIGYMLAGTLASTLGVQTTLTLAAAWAAVSCAAVLVTPSVRELAPQVR